MLAPHDLADKSFILHDGTGNHPFTISKSIKVRTALYTCWKGFFYSKALIVLALFGTSSEIMYDIFYT